MSRTPIAPHLIHKTDADWCVWWFNFWHDIALAIQIESANVDDILSTIEYGHILVR